MVTSVMLLCIGNYLRIVLYHYRKSMRRVITIVTQCVFCLFWRWGRLFWRWVCSCRPCGCSFPLTCYFLLLREMFGRHSPFVAVFHATARSCTWTLKVLGTGLGCSVLVVVPCCEYVLVAFCEKACGCCRVCRKTFAACVWTQVGGMYASVFLDFFAFFSRQGESASSNYGGILVSFLSIIIVKVILPLWSYHGGFHEQNLSSSITCSSFIMKLLSLSVSELALKLHNPRLCAHPPVSVPWAVCILNRCYLRVAVVSFTLVDSRGPPSFGRKSICAGV